MIILLHNPRCSKSREALLMAQQFAAAHGLAVEVIDYQKNPLTLTRLGVFQKQLDLPARDMLRIGRPAERLNALLQDA